MGEVVVDKESEESKETQQANFRNEVALHLRRVACKCKPFEVTIDSFGTFGGKRRGVLWAYPRSKCIRHGEEEAEEDGGTEPLIRLHSLLEDQFPVCTDQRKT